jgi:hypothetical protein
MPEISQPRRVKLQSQQATVEKEIWGKLFGGSRGSRGSQ